MLEQGYNQSDVKVFAFVLGRTVNSPEHRQAASLSVNRIAAACGLSRSTVMRSLKRLCYGDLVAINQDPDWQRHRASEIGIADSLVEKVKTGTSVMRPQGDTRSKALRSGLHRLDCFEGLRRIEEKSIQLILTDLPTGTTDNDWDVPLALERFWEETKRVLTANGAAVVIAAFPYNFVLGGSNLPWLRHELVWVKPSGDGTGFLNAQYAPIRSHETILVFCKGSPTYNPQKVPGGDPYRVRRRPTKTPNYGGSKKSSLTISNGERFPISVLTHSRDRDNPHPTGKPLALLEMLVRSYSNPGDVICDPCAGSASTAIAAMNTTRQFIGFERNKAIFQAAARRMRDHERTLS